MHRDAANGLAVGLSVVSMTVEGNHSLMPVNYFCKARTAQKWKDLLALAIHCFADRSIVGHNHDFRRAQHGKRALQFQCFVEACLDKRFNLFLPKSRQHAATKAAGKAFGAGKADAITFVAAAIQYLAPLGG